MKKINVRFERDDNSEEIEIIVRASQQDAQVSELIERLTEKKTGHLTVRKAVLAEHGKAPWQKLSANIPL